MATVFLLQGEITWTVFRDAQSAERKDQGRKLIDPTGDTGDRSRIAEMGDLDAVSAGLKAVDKAIEDGRVPPANLRVVEADEEGRFSIDHLPTDSYLLVVKGHAGTKQCEWESGFSLTAAEAKSIKLSEPETCAPNYWK
jgi:hypothetical protein